MLSEFFKLYGGKQLFNKLPFWSSFFYKFWQYSAILTNLNILKTDHVYVCIAS